MANNITLSYPSAFYHQFLDKNGKPLTGGKLYTYSAGTSTSIPTYKTIGDTSSTNTNTNPIILDNAGVAHIVIETNKAYKFVLFDKNDAKIDEWDNVTGNIGGGGGGSEDIVVVGTPNEIDVSGSVTQGVKRYVISLSNSVKSTILYLVGLYNNVLNSLGNKADKVQGATAGNIAALDANGNLTDSGSKSADFKTKQTPVTDPSASGAGLEFIDSVTQDANGEITPHKKSVQDGTTTQKGVVKLSNAIDSTSATEAATPKAVKDAYDELNNKIVARAVFLSQAEWAVQSQLAGDPAKVYYVENGTGEDAYTVYVWKESTSTYEEVDESSIDLDGYWHDSPTTTGSGNVVTNITLGNDGIPQVEKGMSAEPAFSILPVSKGGTGKTNEKAALNQLTSQMTHYDTQPNDETLLVQKFGTPTDGNGALYTRPYSYLWAYIKSKISSVLGLSENGYTGNAATATIATSATSAGKLTASKTIAISGGATGTATAFDGSANITIPVTKLGFGTNNAINSVPLGYSSLTGLRSGDQDKPYVQWKNIAGKAFTVGGLTYYGYVLNSNSSATLTYGVNSVTINNTTSNNWVVLVIDDSTYLGSASFNGHDRCSFTLDGRQTYRHSIANNYAIGSAYAVAVNVGFGSFENATASAVLLAVCASGSDNYSGNLSVASGYSSISSGNYSVASGSVSVAAGQYSVASGNSSLASGGVSVASGNNSVASGAYSVAAGQYSVAQHTGAHVAAYNGISGNDYQHVVGKWNAIENNRAFVIGWGTAENDRKNVMSVGTDGEIYFKESNTGLSTQLAGKLGTSGDGSNVTSTFTKASGDTSTMTNGSKLSAIFTAISSFFASVASALGGKADKANITGATKCKISYNGQGIVTGGADLEASDIPNLPASKITSGTFGTDRIADDAITADKVKDNETLPVNVSGSASQLSHVTSKNEASTWRQIAKLESSDANRVLAQGFVVAIRERINDSVYYTGTYIVSCTSKGSDCRILQGTRLANGYDMEFVVAVESDSITLYAKSGSYSPYHVTALFGNPTIAIGNALGSKPAGADVAKTFLLDTSGQVGSPSIPVYVDPNGQLKPCTQGSTLKSNTATLYIAGYTDNNIPYYHVKDIKNGCVNHVDFSGITNSTCDITFEAPTLSTGEEYDYIISLEGYTNNNGYSTGPSVENCKQVLYYDSVNNLWRGEPLFLQATDWRQICVVRGNTCEWKRVALS